MKRIEKRSGIIIFLLVILFVVLFIGKQNGITGLVILSPSLANGTFNNTYFDGESVQLNLSGNFSKGTYIGQIVKFEENTSLNNLTWNDSQCFNTVIRIINKTEDKETSIKNKKIKEIESIVLYENQIASNLTFFIKDCEDINCENTSWIFVDDPTKINLSNQQFQYKFKFDTENLSCSPKLYSVEINYEILNNISNFSEPIKEITAPKDTSKSEGKIIKTFEEEKKEDQTEEISGGQEEGKEERSEVRQSPPKENQNMVTGFFTFAKDNVLIVNGFTLFLALFILLYIFVIRRKDFRMGQNYKKIRR